MSAQSKWNLDNKELSRMLVERWVIERKRVRVVGEYTIREKKGIEIGPLCYPIVERECAPNILYLDHATREELCEKYGRDPSVDVDRIPQIDIVVKDGDLAAAVAGSAPFDFVLAAHVIEHIPDVITWLQQIESVLVDGGKLILIVPDKRFTFDIFRTLTTFNDVSRAFAEKRTRPNLWCLMDCLVNAVSASTWHLWEDYSTASDLPRTYDNATIEKVANVEYLTGRYVDTHCWVFTPWSFLSLLGELVSRRIVSFDCTYFLTTQDHDCEFYLHLTKVAEPSTDWKQLATRIQADALWPRMGDQGTATLKNRLGLTPSPEFNQA